MSAECPARIKTSISPPCRRCSSTSKRTRRNFAVWPMIRRTRAWSWYAQKMLSWRRSHEDRAPTNWVLTADGPFERAAPRR